MHHFAKRKAQMNGKLFASTLKCFLKAKVLKFNSSAHISLFYSSQNQKNVSIYSIYIQVALDVYLSISIATK